MGSTKGHDMKYIGSTVAIIGAVVSLGFLAPAAASAAPNDPSATPAAPAQGAFGYTARDDNHYILSEPYDFVCYDVEGVGPVENNTDRVAQLYYTNDCRGPWQELGAYSRTDYAQFRSVRFIYEH
ncbi:hypothetical protein IU497_33115 [Nocardia terpenica]|uniref:hypothetical protein n=1 Tax=Nocardia terpenica TaxID=455432 RepID=UPI001893E269|nr:hypothetical protein [Nocardia terpenica]MBF6065810.1 hypothetical protein [Nocardia terpenica]MBF6115925.1 hypothetical protein [Nocardia terpenica]